MYGRYAAGSMVRARMGVSICNNHNNYVHFCHMNPDFLDFEQPIVELEVKINELRYVGTDADVNLSEEIQRLQAKCKTLTESIFTSLTPWQIAQLARHPRRPYMLDYVQGLITDFQELHGDRAFSDDPAIVGGVGRFETQPIVVVGHQKGRDTREKIRRNFGMPRPEGYRKALRLMRMAERFRLPVLTFIDTPGAYPGVGAEERGQSEAIARNLQVMAALKVPVICTVIGEGGSGGALAIGVGDHLAMLEYSIYSVISPEGCASILWRSADKASEAAAAMGITAQKSKELKLIDEVIPEPLGGAHRNIEIARQKIKRSLRATLERLQKDDIDKMLERRYDRLMSYGQFKV